MGCTETVTGTLTAGYIIGPHPVLVPRDLRHFESAPLTAANRFDVKDYIIVCVRLGVLNMRTVKT